MNAVKIADLKNNLSRHLARVRRGSTITVLDRDTPVARIVPMDHGGGATRTTPAADRVAELVRKGVVAPGDPQALARWFDDHKPIKLPSRSASAVQVLLDMRRKNTR